MWTRFLIVAAVLGRLLSCVAIGYSQETLSPEQRESLDSIIAKAEASRTFNTYFFDTVWEYEKSGERSFIHSIVSRDQLGRFHCRQEFGTGNYTSNAEIDSWKVAICDGNVFASIAEIPLSEDQLKVIEKPPLRAVIFDASEAASVPEPLEIGDFTTNLKRAIQSGSAIKLSPGSTTNNELTIEYEGSGDFEGKGPPVYIVIVDLSRSSPIATVKENRSQSGELYSQSVIEYRDLGDGKLLPEIEHLELFVGPKLKRTHRLLTARLNGPDDFPAETFDINLPAGTIVWDKRHEIEYRLQTAGVINDKLDELALQAKVAQTDGAELAPSRQLLEQLVVDSEIEPLSVGPPRSKLWFYLVGVNLAIIGGYLAFAFYRNWTSQRQRG